VKSGVGFYDDYWASRTPGRALHGDVELGEAARGGLQALIADGISLGGATSVPSARIT